MRRNATTYFYLIEHHLIFFESNAHNTELWIIRVMKVQCQIEKFKLHITRQFNFSQPFDCISTPFSTVLCPSAVTVNMPLHVASTRSVFTNGVFCRRSPLIFPSIIVLFLFVADSVGAKRRYSTCFSLTGHVWKNFTTHSFPFAFLSRDNRTHTIMSYAHSNEIHFTGFFSYLSHFPRSSSAINPDNCFENCLRIAKDLRPPPLRLGWNPLVCLFK